MRVELNENCKDEHWSLSAKKSYLVVGVDDNNYRIVDDESKPYLFPKIHFALVDDWVPGDWTKIEYEDGEFYFGPQKLCEPGFYEDFHDDVEEAVSDFWEVFRELEDRENTMVDEP